MAKKRKRRRRRKNKKQELPEHLVREEDFAGIDPVELMGQANLEIEEEKEQAKEEWGEKAPDATETPDPEDVDDVLPPSFWALPEFDKGTVQKYQFTLAVAEATIAVKQVGNKRMPEAKFLCRIAVTHYYMQTIKGGSKRPALSYQPITEPFTITLPATLLPTKYRKNPDDLSPKAASDLLMAMFNQMNWEQLRPAPKPDHERMLPENIMKLMGLPQKGGS